jgi:hypothetical protein
MEETEQNGGRKASPKHPYRIDSNDKNFKIFKQAMLDSISESDLSVSDYLGSDDHDRVLQKLYSSISQELNLEEKSKKAGIQQ